MDLGLTTKERAALRRLAEGDSPTVAAAARILLDRDAGLSYRKAGAEAGRTGAYAHLICKQFVGGGRLGCVALRPVDAHGNPKRPFPGRGNG